MSEQIEKTEFTKKCDICELEQIGDADIICLSCYHALHAHNRGLLGGILQVLNRLSFNHTDSDGQIYKMLFLKDVERTFGEIGIKLESGK